MNKRDKGLFISDLVRSVTNEILEKVPNMPEEWDGHELRRYIADRFEEAAFTVGRKGPYGRDYHSRTRAYRNAVVVNNL